MTTYDRKSVNSYNPYTSKLLYTIGAKLGISMYCKIIISNNRKNFDA